MKIQWEVDDGYVGPSRPHFLTIDDEELEGMSEEERLRYIDEAVREDFEQHCSFDWKIVSE